MNMLKVIFTTAAISIFIFSCTNQHEGAETQEAITVDEHKSQKQESDANLELNNSEKWLVNNEMKPYVTKGITLVDEYIGDNKSEYVVLAEQLKTQNNLVISSCTMKGKSHDELHKWLYPHLELVAELEKTKNINDANLLVLQLKDSYFLYNQYFQ